MESMIIGAFGEDQVAILTNLSRAQLRAWNRRGFIRPEYRQNDGGKRGLWCKFLNSLVLRYVPASCYAASTAVHMAGADLVRI
jgi:hypothetical protein